MIFIKSYRLKKKKNDFKIYDVTEHEQKKQIYYNNSILS